MLTLSLFEADSLVLSIGDDRPSIRTELIPEFSLPIYFVEIKLNDCSNSFSIFVEKFPTRFELLKKFLTICCSSAHEIFSFGGQKGAFCLPLQFSSSLHQDSSVQYSLDGFDILVSSHSEDLSEQLFTIQK